MLAVLAVLAGLQLAAVECKQHVRAAASTALTALPPGPQHAAGVPDGVDGEVHLVGKGAGGVVQVSLTVAWCRLRHAMATHTGAGTGRCTEERAAA